MYKRMLVPLDGSKMAEVVFPYAREVAARLSVGLDFLHVCSPEEADTLPMRQAYIEHMAEMIGNAPEEQDAGVPARKTRKKIPATGRALIGYPADEILRYAEENNDDVIMVATHGRSGLKRWALGSVSYKITHSSRKPVWLIRAGVPEDIIFDKLPRRTTLVLLDGSKLAESSLPHLVALSKQRGTKLINICLLNVCDPSHLSPLQYHRMPLGISGIPTNWEEYERHEHQRCTTNSEAYLKDVAGGLKEQGLSVEIKVLEGNPGEQIIKFVEANPIQLIVMSTYGHTGIDRLVYSSTVEKVLLGVHTPIFLVPSPDEG
jgi:nucleotide-binding universal stress UspA family protein